MGLRSAGIGDSGRVGWDVSGGQVVLRTTHRIRCGTDCGCGAPCLPRVAIGSRRGQADSHSHIDGPRVSLREGLTCRSEFRKASSCSRDCIRNDDARLSLLGSPTVAGCSPLQHSHRGGLFCHPGNGEGTRISNPRSRSSHGPWDHRDNDPHFSRAVRAVGLVLASIHVSIARLSLFGNPAQPSDGRGSATRQRLRCARVSQRDPMLSNLWLTAGAR